MNDCFYLMSGLVELAYLSGFISQTVVTFDPKSFIMPPTKKHPLIVDTQTRWILCLCIVMMLKVRQITSVSLGEYQPGIDLLTSLKRILRRVISPHLDDLRSNS
jgi:hypothetical protein